jgi:hypothetical protein
MFEISIPTCMKHNHDSNDFTTAHSGLSLGCISQKAVFDGIVKFYAELIGKIENFRNFSVS